MQMQELIASEIFTKHIVLKRNEFLTVENTVDTFVYYVESGSLRIFVHDGEEERNCRFAYTGNLFVSLDSFLSDQPSGFSIQAIKLTKVWVASKVDFMNLVADSSECRDAYTRILEDLIIQQLEREKDLLTHSPKLRYKRVLKRSPQVFQEIPHKHIANYLRMTPETLSRLKKS